MGAKNLGRAAKYGWQSERMVAQGTKAEILGTKSAKSADKAMGSLQKLKAGKGVNASIKAGYASRQGAKAGSIIGAATGGAIGTVDYTRKSKHQGIRTRKN